MRRRRSAYTLFQLLALLAILLILLGLLLPAVQRVRAAAARMQSQNNLKQIAIAFHNYEQTHTRFPPGVDMQQLSGLVHILPYIEQQNLYQTIDLTKSPDHASNATARGTWIKTYLSPLDTDAQPDPKAGPTSYFLVAGSQHDLERSDGVFFSDSRIRLADILDGTSNTIMTLETLRGDGQKRALSVQRQHVRLKKADLKGLTDAAGVKDFAANVNIVGDRGVSWMDGRFLRSTINLTREFDDARPDVDCDGDGGLAGPRHYYPGTNIGMADGSVRFISKSVKRDTWKALATRAGGEVLMLD